MKSAVAVRHIHFEDLGVLEPFLREQGYEVRYLDAGVDDLVGVDAASPDLVVVLGAPIGAGDEETYPFLADELRLVRRRLDVQRPLLGICLGAQLIARVLGAQVKPMGVRGDRLLLLDPYGGGEGFATRRPGALGRSCIGMATSSAFPMAQPGWRTPTSAPIRRSPWGGQCSVCSFTSRPIPAKIERWLLGHACELSQAGVDPRKIRQQAREFGRTLSAAAPEVIGEWLAD